MRKLRKFLPELDNQLKITVSIVICISLGLITYLSIFQLAGRFGSIIGGYLATLFGRGAFIIPSAFFVVAYLLYALQKEENVTDYWNTRIGWGIVFVILAFEGYLSLFFDVQNMLEILQGGGVVGYIMYPILFGVFGKIGGFVLLTTILGIGFFLLSQLPFYKFAGNIVKVIKNPGLLWEYVPDFFTEEVSEEVVASSFQSTSHSQTSTDGNTKPKTRARTKPKTSIDKETGETVIDVQAGKPETKKSSKPRFSFATAEDDVLEMRPTDVLADWTPPQFDILRKNTSKVEPGDIESNKEIIRNTLAHFGISVEMGDTRVGPTVTQYTLKPANGVKLSAIDNLQRDLALALAAQNIRIEAPIAGQSLVGIEIPNKQKSMVRLDDMIRTKRFHNFSHDLPVAIGQDVAGQNVIYSLAKMPHLLVAGATGSGKSVWINGMLLSLLFKYAPYELQLILVDMKRVELKLYDGIPHLLAPVITDSEKAINALKWCIIEMDRRYKILEDYGKRNIVDYNTYAAKAKIEKLPYTVLVIDELGDLMMTSKSEVEPIIVRLTQMSRAVGIHLVLGTQRPDTHVVTGLIKANVPSRIAFAVASQIDSRVIIDQGGAEKLLGHGDGMFMSPASMHPMRFQGPNVEESEVRKCVEYIRKQGEMNGLSNRKQDVVEPPRGKVNVPGMSASSDSNSGDDVFEEARSLVIRYQKASASFLQQMMGIGYPKAARIIQQLEEMGVVGPQNGSKPREVYVTEEVEEVTSSEQSQ